MRLIILIALGLALCSALPQEGRRGAGIRGSRRISLSSRDEQAADPNEDATAASGDPTEAESPPTRKGTSLRRGRPSPLLNSKTGDQTANDATKVNVAERPIGRQTQPTDPDQTRERKALAIRRPKKSTTTTTTTTTLAPAVENEMPEMTEEIINEESKVMMDDNAAGADLAMHNEEADAKTDMLMEKKAMASSGIEAQEENEAMEKPSEPQAELPRSKLRPIPIKIGRRTDSEVPVKQTQEEEVVTSPEEAKAAETEDGSSSSSRHRFASRSRSSPVSIKTRGSSRGQSQSEQTAEAPVETAQTAVKKPRGRGPSARISSPRIPSRRQQPDLMGEAPEQSIDVPAILEEEVSTLDTETRSSTFGRRQRG